MKQNLEIIFSFLIGEHMSLEKVESTVEYIKSRMI